MIANTGCQGKWKPDLFGDKEPLKMTQVRFSFHFNEENEIQIFNWVGLELWSMSDNTSFDNLLITDNMVLAVAFTRETFDLKQAADASANALQSQHFQVLAPKSSLI